jgi:hypothetical protein
MTTGQLLLVLIRYAIRGGRVVAGELDGSDWQELYALSKDQGVAGICFDAVSRLKKEGCIEIDPILFTEWYGVMRVWENQYAKHQYEIKNLSRFYSHFGIRMLLLKGYGVSFSWPVPQHRPCGDIDIFLFEDKDFIEQGKVTCAQDRGDALITEKLHLKVNRGTSHHSDFDIEGVNVENHKDLLDDESHRANAVVGDALLSLVAAGRGTDRIMADGVEVAVPSATFNALYLLRHAGLHFATERLLLRQVLDWGLMVQGTKDIDWDFVLRVVREQKMERFLDCMIEICVCDLGMDASCFPPFQRRGRLKDRVLGDILSPEFSEENDTVIGVNLRYIIYKVRRFVANRWKYRLVYPTSLWGIFWNLAWNRLRMND